MQFSDKFHNIHWKNLITAVAIPLAVGGLSAWITKDGMKAFETVNQPPLTPPMWLFPVVWSILFVLMGIASYLVVMQKGEDTKALTLYTVQLIFNFFWSIWFFNLGWYLFAFLWLVALWILILATTVAFYPHLEACRMADAALSGVGCARGVSESGGVVAEPVISRFHPIDHEDIDTHRQCKSFLFSQFLFHNIFNCFNICES